MTTVYIVVFTVALVVIAGFMAGFFTDREPKPRHKK